ncbi:uncharacterized protein LOC8082572 isoform X2 [Sorghum bicolor]|uniref:uncharacterized protein LOC8082572 isoform X2 n=1 Tax=Sorghum bicolor TaxID=4558 RepID=UPI000B424C90|nr:uncharacterized protein LOC8082572 isoform X2 [Sorghum bicolor]|eukprot:XP_021319646.1 uncharacterized protein LOC8082572 isoform X2 [Sorghum bicolor]
MSAMAAGRRLLHLPGLELCLRSRALTLLSSSRADGMARYWREPPRRKLVTCRQGAFEEGNADELLGHCKDANGRALDLEPIGKSSANESVQLSFEEEESDDVVCEISESLVRDVEKAAIELLAARAFTVSELRKKLRSKKYPFDTIDAVIANFKSRGLLNDGFYAESFSRSRWLSSTWGPRRIKQALRQKGVPEAEVDQATRRVFQDGHGHGKEATFGISEASMDHLFAQASKQWQRGQSLTLENRRARIVRWLQYRGFNWAVTNSIIRRLEAQHPP